MINQPVCAVILAAGIGERLSRTLPDRPKGFLELAGVPLIERSIQQLLAVGIREIIIVTGYASAYYDMLARRYPEISLAHNENYAVSGSMFSLYCARERIRDTFLLLESDLVYESRALKELIACSKSNAILMSGFTQSDDEVFISTRGDCVFKLSKRRSELHNVTGELVGISKISPEMYSAMIHYAGNHFQRDLYLHYEDCINGITGHVPVYHHKIDDLIWAEIDTPEHFQRVERIILPRLTGEWTVLKSPENGRF